MKLRTMGLLLLRDVAVYVSMLATSELIAEDLRAQRKEQRRRPGVRKANAGGREWN